jgi:hypothetical protein
MMNTMMKTMMILTDMIEAKVVIHQILNWQLPKELISLITQRERIETINQAEKDLRNVKLTTKDYIDHEKSQKAGKDGKYKITVPKPFGFDVREKTRSKSIREKKLEEMIAEKKVKEENIIKHQFRSKPIPPEVLIPRYNTIIENNERRRLEVKKNSIAITQQTEKPFSFYIRDKNK